MKPDEKPEDWLSGPTPGQLSPELEADIEKMDKEQAPKDEKPEKDAYSLLRLLRPVQFKSPGV